MPKHLTNENIKLQYSDKTMSLVDANNSSIIAEVSLPYSIEIVSDLTIKSEGGYVYAVSVSSKGELITELVSNESEHNKAILMDNNGKLFNLVVDDEGLLGLEIYNGESKADRIYLQAEIPDAVIFRLGAYTSDNNETVLCTGTINASVVDDDAISNNLTWSSKKINDSIKDMNDSIKESIKQITGVEVKEYLPLSGGTLTGDLIGTDFISNKLITSTDGGGTIGHNVQTNFHTDQYGQGRIRVENKNNSSILNMIFNPHDRTISVDGHLRPAGGTTYSLGSDSNMWNNIVMNGVIYINKDDGRKAELTGNSLISKTHSLYLRGGDTAHGIYVDSNNTSLHPDGNGFWNLGKSDLRWKNAYVYGDVSSNSGVSGFTLRHCQEINSVSGNPTAVLEIATTSDPNGGDNAILRFYNDGSQTGGGQFFVPKYANSVTLGREGSEFREVYTLGGFHQSSDRTLKENIQYINSTDSDISYNDMYNFVKDDLELARYNFKNDDKERMNFIAQDLLANADGTDNKIGQMIVSPIAVPSEKQIEIAKANLDEGEEYQYPKLSFDSGIYTSVLAGALKEAINKIEQLEARIDELENK